MFDNKESTFSRVIFTLATRNEHPSIMNLQSKNLGLISDTSIVLFPKTFPDVLTLDLGSNDLWKLDSKSLNNFRRIFPQVKVIIINNNYLGKNYDGLFAAAHAFPNATKLYMSNNSFGLLSVSEIRRLHGAFTKIKSLSLNDNKLNVFFGQQIIELSNIFPNVNSLSLCNNGLSSQQMLSFLIAFKQTQSINLTLNDAKISPNFISKLKELIKNSNYSLSRVALKLGNRIEKADEIKLNSICSKELDRKQGIKLGTQELFKFFRKNSTFVPRDIVNEIISFTPEIIIN